MTVDELLHRISARELAEWQYVLGKEAELEKAVRSGIDPEIAQSIVLPEHD